MIDAGARARLAKEALLAVRGEHLGADDLDGGVAVEGGIAGQVYRAHAALAEFLPQLVAAQMPGLHPRRLTA
jgi:hypothetical protein